MVRLTGHFDMTITVDWDINRQTKPKPQYMFWLRNMKHELIQKVLSEGVTSENVFILLLFLG